MMRRIAYLAGAALLAQAAAAWAALPDLKNMHDGVAMPNACKPAEAARLRREVAALAAGSMPDQAARLVQEMLCGTSAQSRTYLLAHTAAKVLSLDESTGDTEAARPVYIAGRTVEAARMRAWSATADPGDNGIRVSFYADEGACIRSFVLTFRRAGWLISAISQACD